MGHFVEKDKGLGNIELQLQSVEKGSDIFHFLVTIPTLLPIKECLESINSYFEFIRNIQSIKHQSVQDTQKKH